MTGSTRIEDLRASLWLPIAALDDLEPGGALLRFALNAERLVAFRSPDGSPGIMQEACPHRCASLALARNEEDGLRCIYHGWKMARDGEILEVPTEPDPRRAAALTGRLRVRSYAAVMARGLLWMWGGAPDEATPSPRDGDHRFISAVDVALDWLDLSTRFQLAAPSLERTPPSLFSRPGDMMPVIAITPLIAGRSRVHLADAEAERLIRSICADQQRPLMAPAARRALA